MKNSRKSLPFINPYNFVGSPGNEQTTSSDRKPVEKFHDRFHEEAFAGRIVAEIKTLTPLFIPDPEKSDRKKQPQELVFNRDMKDRPLIPASSIKGMMRAVYEALRDSCYSNLHPARLDYREVNVSKYLKSAIVLDIDEHKRKAEIGLFDAMAWVPAGYKGKPDYLEKLPNTDGPLCFAWAKIKKNRYIVKQSLKNNTGKKIFDELSKWADAKDKTLTIKKKKKGPVLRLEDMTGHDIKELEKAFQSYFHGNLVKIPYHCVSDYLQPEKERLPEATADEAIYQVLLKKTGDTINNKHDERVFFSEQYPWNLKSNLYGLARKEIDYSQVRDINHVLSGQHDRFQKEENQREADRKMEARLNRSGGIPQIRKNDLVYYLESDERQGLALVLIPRLRYRNSPEDLLPERLRPCGHTDSLCPACRVIGTAKSNAASHGRADTPGFRGKLAFSPGRIQNNNYTIETDLLQTLGEPKPTATTFYLKDSGSDAVTVESGGYDKSGAMLRGRKFYWHQSNGRPALTRDHYAKDRSDNPKVDIKAELLHSGAKFCFTVDFENLTEMELAALVWTMELSDGLYHHLGMGKPLGLGTVKLAIDRTHSFVIQQKNLQAYYRDIRANVGDFKEALPINALKQKIDDTYGQMPHYRDLTRILAYDPAIAENVQYPGFKWFADRKHKNWQMPPIDKVYADFSGNKRAKR